MKKLFFAMMAIATVLSACKSNKDIKADPDADNAAKWTAEQKASIENIKAIEGSDGHLFEMTYTADYKLPELMKSDCGSIEESLVRLYSTLLPNSRILLTSASTQGVGCSTFSSACSDGGYVLGRNYDYPVKGSYYIVVRTAPEKGYKSIGIADVSTLLANPDPKNPFSTVRNQEITLFAPFSILDGMNEKGFMCSFMQLEYESTMQDRGKTKMVNNWILRILLDNCETVSEAIAMMDQFDIRSVFQKEDMDLHYILADAYGDRAIVEYVANEMHVLRAPELIGEDAPYVMSTNFYLTPGRRVDRETGLWEKNELGYWRFDQLCHSLKNNPCPSRAEAMDYMKNVRIVYNDQDEIEAIKRKGQDPEKFENWSWMSLWSSVYNSKNLTMDVCIRENYDKKFSFILK
ncbi:MAG: linear amide C-N hydrolase [Paludibacteraceae bacterium]|nr:linear amide C-N hydrolase [Paludibacteraceae bacterium]